MRLGGSSVRPVGIYDGSSFDSTMRPRHLWRTSCSPSLSRRDHVLCDSNIYSTIRNSAQRFASTLAPQRSACLPRTCRRAALPERGNGSGQEEVDPTSLEAAAATMEIIWDLACERDEDTLLGFIPDSVLEQAAELRYKMECSDDEAPPPEGLEPGESGLAAEARSRSAPQRQRDTRPVTLRDVVYQSHGMKGFVFDSFATRHLYVSPPPTRGSVQRLSCMRTAPNRAVLRYAVARDGGEHAVLTFGLECEERLAPHYRSARVEYVWQLVSVTGEALELAAEEGAGPVGPHPALPPEAVIRAQLDALACEDIAGVFAFASPANKVVTGPLERFTMLLRNPMYRPLLRHHTAEPLNLGTLRPGYHNAVVKVVSANTGMAQEIEMVFHWVLSRQASGSGPHANCWMTDSVELVSARIRG